MWSCGEARHGGERFGRCGSRRKANLGSASDDQREGNSRRGTPWSVLWKTEHMVQAAGIWS